MILCHIKKKGGGARGVMVIAVGNRHGDMSSNPGRDRLHFTNWPCVISCPRGGVGKYI